MPRPPWVRIPRQAGSSSPPVGFGAAGPISCRGPENGGPLTPRPTLTLIVPVHDVVPYLRRCLDSLTADPGDEVEVIVVDDASTDGTAEELHRIAASRPELRVISNAERVGPGRSRNRGLDEARGDYLWFVDGDDWLLDGAVPRVLARIEETGADVVLVDHVRTYPSGRTAESSSRHLLLQAPTRPFRLAEWPDTVGVLHTPWNKVVQRSFLERQGIRFSASPVYEDVSFTYQVLAAAERIAVVAEPGYAYRTSRPGALTRTPGVAHLAWFDEWARVLELAEQQPPAVRTALVERMHQHGWSVLGLRDGRRLPLPLRREFFRRFSALSRTTESWHARPHRALAIGWWPVGEVRAVTDSMAWFAGRLWRRLSRSS
jgi:CDP-glycerol glycerophosphotransferase